VRGAKPATNKASHVNKASQPSQQGQACQKGQPCPAMTSHGNIKGQPANKVGHVNKANQQPTRPARGIS
jgi:hypothetical protein